MNLNILFYSLILQNVCVCVRVNSEVSDWLLGRAGVSEKVEVSAFMWSYKLLGKRQEPFAAAAAPLHASASHSGDHKRARGRLKRRN